MKRYILYLAVFLAIFSIRFYFDNNSLNKAKASLPQETQTHVFEVRDDPENKFFMTKIIAIDKNLNQRMILKGNSETSSKLLAFKVGDSFEAIGYFLPLNEYDNYLYQQHVVGEFKVEELKNVHASNNIIENLSTYVRTTVTNGCARLSTNTQGICEGILIGEKSHISKETYDKYKRAQLTHLLVASGANIVFILAFLSPLLKRLKLRPRFILMCVIAVLYCVITRFEPSILRACVMVCLPSIAKVRGYRINELKIFMFSIATCLLIDSFLLLRVGFWLSTFATGGLYFLTPRIKNHIHSELIASTLAATIAVQPVLWMAFGFSWPFKWPISVMAISLAEPLSTLGFVGISFSSYLDITNSISFLITKLMEGGCSLLNLTASLGESTFSSFFGAIISLCIVFRLCRKYQKKKKESILISRQFRYYQ